MESIKIMASLGDKLDRLLVSFKDAKVCDRSISGCYQLTSSFQVALLEWSDAVHDLITVSIHTYERAPQLVSIRKCSFSLP
jgi:cleavage and polyadenylation specificity factor subunit 1